LVPLLRGIPSGLEDRLRLSDLDLDEDRLDADVEYRLLRRILGDRELEELFELLLLEPLE